MISIYDKELTETECDELIALGDKNLVPAKTLGKEIPGYRVADNCWLYDKTDVLNRIKERLAKITGLPIENQEAPHIIRYRVGGEYKQHHDFFFESQDYFDKIIKNGGQRVFSCLYYLNDGFSGGQTFFPNKQIGVSPRTGRLLIWRNMTESAELDYDSLHAGLPVYAGEKWILVIWVREKEFKY